MQHAVKHMFLFVFPMQHTVKPFFSLDPMQNTVFGPTQNIIKANGLSKTICFMWVPMLNTAKPQVFIASYAKSNKTTWLSLGSYAKGSKTNGNVFHWVPNKKMGPCAGIILLI